MITNNKKNLSKEGHPRTFIKTISWRIIATLTTMSIVFIITKKVTLAIEVGMFEIILKILFYYLHERLWQRLNWGKNDHPLSSIPIKEQLKPKDMEIIKNKLQELGYID